MVFLNCKDMPKNAREHRGFPQNRSQIICLCLTVSHSQTVYFILHMQHI